MARSVESKTADKILRLDDVLDMLGIGRSTLYRMIKEGTFPSGQKISKRCVGWRYTTVLQWMSRNTAGVIHPGFYTNGSLKPHTSHALNGYHS
jgi:prophage regulatory protein